VPGLALIKMVAQHILSPMCKGALGPNCILCLSTGVTVSLGDVPPTHSIVVAA